MMSGPDSKQPSIILATRSVYRVQLFARLGLEYGSIAADIDESQQNNEDPTTYVERLSREKAARVAEDHPSSLVIGSDQCAVIKQDIVGKPETRENAIHQLQLASGNDIEFLSGVCLLHVASGWTQYSMVPFHVKFRDLTIEEIERYLDRENPLDCAGSFKSEGLGVTLCESMHGDDPTALIGLPLIQVSSMLREFGVKVP